MSELERFQPRLVAPKPWGTELLVAHTPLYTGKVLTMRAGATGPLQYHERKDETFYLFSGQALVHTEHESHPMTAGESWHVPPGAVHRVEAVTEAVFFEVSNPIFDDRVPVTKP